MDDERLAPGDKVLLELNQLSPLQAKRLALQPCLDEVLQNAVEEPLQHEGDQVVLFPVAQRAVDPAWTHAHACVELHWVRGWLLGGGRWAGR